MASAHRRSLLVTRRRETTREPARDETPRTLLDVARGGRVRIVGISGDRRLTHRLTALGLVPGASITVLRPSGPGLVSVNGTRVAIDRRAASALTVEEIGR